MGEEKTLSGDAFTICFYSNGRAYLPKQARNGQKWVKNWSKISKNGQELARNGPKIGQNCQKSVTFSAKEIFPGLIIMADMNDPKAQRVAAEIGLWYNPHYIEDLLKKIMKPFINK